MSSFKNILLIDQCSSKPKYRQLVENIISSVEKGAVTGGERLPSLNDIANQYEVARVTVSKSYDELKDRKIIVSRHGKGFFISERAAEIISGRSFHYKMKTI